MLSRCDGLSLMAGMSSDGLIGRGRGALVLAAVVALGLPAPLRAAESSLASVKPVVGLRDCGNGGMALPGSSTCLRVGGSIRSDATATIGARSGTVHDGLRSVTRLTSTARVDLDVRTPTEWGPLRAFTSVRLRSPGSNLR